MFAFNKLDDFDTWWHLASGRWIATHQSVPATDTLSHTVPTHPWINLQWGFDLGLYGLFALGGPVLACLAGALAFTGAFVLLLRLLSRHVDGAVAALLGCVVVLIAQERVALRPELLSFLLLTGVLSVLDRARAHGGRRLFLLVPLMLIWVNVHALFVIGVFAIACTLITVLTEPATVATPRKPWLMWCGAALAVVVVNPFGVRGALFPLQLISRINGTSPVFAMIPEFTSPFDPTATGLAITVYKAYLVVGALIMVMGAVAAMRRSKDRGAPRLFGWGDLVWFVGLAAVSMAARRNVAMFAIGVAPALARSLAMWWSVSPAWHRSIARRASLVSSVVLVVSFAVAGLEASGALPRWDHQPREFGAGIIEGTFPMRAVAFARAAQLPAKLFNDMGAGGYLTWDDPTGGGVYVDGRLEVYDTPFLTDLAIAESNPARWQSDADRYGVETAIVFHRFEPGRQVAGALAQSPAWTYVYGDEVAAIFVRAATHSDAIARAAALRPRFDAETAAWLAAPVARWPYPAGRVEGLRAYARFLATIGQADQAVAAYQKYLELGVPTRDEIEVRLLLARFFTNRGRLPEAREQLSRILAADPSNPDAIALMR